MERLRRRFFPSFSSVPSGPVDLGLLVCTACFATGLPPRGCTKQLSRIKTGPPFAGTSRRQTRWPAPSNSIRPPRRLFQATRSRSHERSEFGASSTRGQPRGKVVLVRSYWNSAEPYRGPIKATRSGTVCLDLEELHQEFHLAVGRLRQKPHLIQSYLFSGSGP